MESESEKTESIPSLEKITTATDTPTATTTATTTATATAATTRNTPKDSLENLPREEGKIRRDIPKKKKREMRMGGIKKTIKERDIDKSLSQVRKMQVRTVTNVFRFCKNIGSPSLVFDTLKYIYSVPSIKGFIFAVRDYILNHPRIPDDLILPELFDNVGGISRGIGLEFLEQSGLWQSYIVFSQHGKNDPERPLSRQIKKAIMDYVDDLKSIHERDTILTLQFQDRHEGEDDLVELDNQEDIEEYVDDRLQFTQIKNTTFSRGGNNRDRVKISQSERDRRDGRKADTMNHHKNKRTPKGIHTKYERVDGRNKKSTRDTEEVSSPDTIYQTCYPIYSIESYNYGESPHYFFNPEPNQ